MVIAYILASVKSGTERETIELLRKEPQVREVNMVYGEFDIVIKVELSNISDLSDFVLDKIRAIGNIEKTTTLIVAA